MWDALARRHLTAARNGNVHLFFTEYLDPMPLFHYFIIEVSERKQHLSSLPDFDGVQSKWREFDLFLDTKPSSLESTDPFVFDPMLHFHKDSFYKKIKA